MTDPSTPDSAAQSRAEQIHQIVNDCRRRRAAGEVIEDDSIIAAYPELMPELAESLRGLRLVEAVQKQVARQPKPVSDDSRVQCPHCESDMEIADDTSVQDLTCPSCGSRFSSASDPHIPVVDSAADAVGATVESDQPAESDSDLNAEAISGYSIIRELHRGGQGVVYQAIQRSTKQKVALKVMLQGPFASREHRRRFEREIELVGSLQHPNIAKIFDSGIADGQMYFAMQYIRGQRLTDYVRDKQLSVDDTLHLLKKVCDAVDHAHQRGVIHRDLKPSNILVDDGGQPYVVDFGLAKIGGAGGLGDGVSLQASVTGQIVGTPAYMSPEQAAGLSDQIDLRSDVYALGVLLYESLTGQMPYDVSGTITEVLRTIQQSEPTRPRSLHHNVNDEVETITLKALSKEKQRRYATAGMLGEDIGRYLAGQPIEAKRDSVLYLMRKTLRRYRAAAAVAAVFSIVVMAALVVSLAFWRQAVRDRETAETRTDEARAAQALALAARDDANEARRLAEETSNLFRRHSYISDMNLASQAYDAGRTGRVFELLEKHWPTAGEKDLRGFEWYHWWQATHLEHGSIRHPSRAPFASLAISPDGRTIAATGFPNSLFIYDSVRFRLLRAPIDRLNDPVAFSPNGEYLIAGASEDGGSLHVYQCDSWALAKIMSAPGGGGISSIAFSPTEPVMAAGGTGKRVVLFSTQSWESETHWDTGAIVRSVGFTPDGASVVAAMEDSTVVAWDLATRDVKHSIHGQGVNVIACSPIGGLFAAASGNTVSLWSQDLRPIDSAVFETPSLVTALAFSPSGKRLLAGTSGNNEVLIWDVAPHSPSLMLAHTIRGHSKEIKGVAFAPDNHTVWSADGGGEIKCWRLSRCEPYQTLKHVDRAARVSYAADAGQTLLIIDQKGTVERWNVLKHAPLEAFNAGREYSSVAVSDDGTVLIAATPGGQTELWDVVAAEPRLRRRAVASAKSPSSVAVTPDGSTAALASSGDEIVVWDPASGQTRIVPVKSYAGIVALSADGLKLAVCTWLTTQLWDLATDPPEFLNEMVGWGPEFCCVFSPHSDVVAVGSHDSSIRLRDAKTGRLKQTLKGHTDTVYSIAFSHDGTLLVSGGKDQTVRIWDVQAGQLLTTFRGHAAPVTSVDFSPAGNSVASCGSDGTVKIWTAASKQGVHQDLETWIERADYYAGRQDWENAYRVFAEAIKLSPDSPELFAARGDLYGQHGKSTEAVADYARAIQLRPHDGKLYKQRADLHVRFSQRGDAIADYAKAVVLSEELRSIDSFEQIQRSLVVTLVPRAARWRYTLDQPPNNWQIPDEFDDSPWHQGQAPFGQDFMWPQPGTRWGESNPDDIWMRYTFELDRDTTAPLILDAYVDDVAEIYVNGVEAVRASWVGDRYQTLECSPNAKLRRGLNVLAVHCRNTNVYGKIDVSLVARGDDAAVEEILAQALHMAPDNSELQQRRSEWEADRGR